MWLQATHAWFCSIQGVVRVTYLEQDNVMTPSLRASEMPPRESHKLTKGGLHRHRR
jgi:hypothetical protein